MNTSKSIFAEGVVLTVEPFEDFVVSEQNVSDSWNKIKEHEIQNPDIFITDHTWGGVEGKTIKSKNKSFTSTIRRLNGQFSNGDILKEAELEGFKNIYSWIEAKKIIEQAVLNNEINGRHNCVIVYYQFEENNALYVLSARRHARGHLEIVATERELEDGLWIMDDGGVCF